MWQYVLNNCLCAACAFPSNIHKGIVEYSSTSYIYTHPHSNVLVYKVCCKNQVVIGRRAILVVYTVKT